MINRASSFLLLLAPLAMAQQDAAGSSDHPIVPRYPGSFIRFYEQQEFAKYRLALAVENNRPSGVKEIEGKVTRISYQNPAGRSAHEVFTNYRDALVKAGFQSLFSCEGPSCGFAMYWQKFNGLYATGGPRDVRFLTVRSKNGERDITVAISVNTAQSIVHIVEQRPRD